MSKKETLKFIVQLIASIATAIATALAPPVAWATDHSKPHRHQRREREGPTFTSTNAGPLFSNGHYLFKAIIQADATEPPPGRVQNRLFDTNIDKNQ